MLTDSVFAFSCQSANGSIGAGGSNKPVDVWVNINSNIFDNKSTVININQVTCTGVVDLNVTDYLKTTAMASVFSPNLFVKNKTGLVIDGVRFYTPIASDISVLSIKSFKPPRAPGWTETKPLNVQLFIDPLDKPDTSVSIHRGDVIGQIDFYQSNDLGGCPGCGPYRWRLIANNDAIFVTNTCTVNDGHQINIEFGKIIRTNLKADIFNGEFKKNQSLNIYCKSPVTQDVMLRLVSDKSPFSGDLTKTSNPDIGIAMLHDGQLVRPGEEFRSRIVKGQGSDEVTFNVVKNNRPSSAIATGDFTGSATLIVSAP